MAFSAPEPLQGEGTEKEDADGQQKSELELRPNVTPEQSQSPFPGPWSPECFS